MMQFVCVCVCVCVRARTISTKLYFCDKYIYFKCWCVNKTYVYNVNKSGYMPSFLLFKFSCLSCKLSCISSTLCVGPSSELLSQQVKKHT